MEINAYNTSQKTSNIDSVNNLKIQKKNEGLDMQDFLNLLVAQITNQDSMNPMDNTEFIAQMAQFSSLQAMSDLTEMTMQGQATSLIGKNVVVADYNNRGELIVDEGIVQRVTIHSGKTMLYVNDMEYEYSNVMEIKEAQKTEEDPLTLMLGEILKGIDNLNDSASYIPPAKETLPTEEVPTVEDIPTVEEVPTTEDIPTVEDIPTTEEI